MPVLGSGCGYPRGFTHLPATHLLCGPVPDRPRPSTGLRPGVWALLSGLCSLPPVPPRGLCGPCCCHPVQRSHIQGRTGFTCCALGKGTPLTAPPRLVPHTPPVRFSPRVTTGEGPGLTRRPAPASSIHVVKSCEAAF